ncbi:hypothetical protein FRC00_001120 [Tulasnella sp. 408]|nr:hypothetical protein FRC00_001120 [Tulasnella sp. 408]
MTTLYKLSASLSGHSQDVRAVASPSPTLLLSASRDSTAIVWTRPDDKSPFTITETYKVSDRFVNAIAYIPPTAEAPKGKVFGNYRVSATWSPALKTAL